MPGPAPAEQSPPAFRLLSAELAGAAAASLAGVVLFLAPVLRGWPNWGIQDWDQHAFYHEAPRVTLLEYGQLPLWNPWSCGGTDLLANPQSRVLSPSYLLVLALGTVAGLKLELFLSAWLGMLGLYALARDRGLDRCSAWLPPAALFLGPFFALPVTAGMSWFLSVAYLPWAVLCYLRGRGAASGACLALVYLGGGVYPLVIAATFLAFLTLLGLRERGLRRSAALLALTAAATLGLGAAKFLPSISLMAEFPRRAEQPSGLSLQSLGVGLFSRDQRLEVGRTHFDDWHHGELLRGISSDFDDVGMYVGPLVAALFALGLATGVRRHWKLAASLGVFLWLSLGDRATPSLFTALHELPVFESMRYAERFRLIWLPCALLFAGFGLRWLRERIERRWPGRAGAWLAAGLVALFAADLYAVTRPLWRSAFPIPPMALSRSPEFRQIARLPHYDARGFLEGPQRFGYGVYASWSAHYPALLMNLGAVECYETAFVPRKAVPMESERYRGEAYLEGAEGEVRLLDWSPNRLRFAVRARGPGRLVVNQNHYRGWQARDGRPVASHRGLLSVAVSPGDAEIELRYGRRSFALGAALSAASWAFLALASARAMRRARRPAPGSAARRPTQGRPPRSEPKASEDRAG